jgi:hypothetical protein
LSESSLAVRGSVRDHALGCLGVTAGLVGAVTDSEPEAWLTADAVDVAAVAAELVVGDDKHVANTDLL